MTTMNYSWPQTVHLATLCGDLHMHHTGACEDMSDEEYLTALARVRAAVERWKPPSRPEVAPFDAAVYALCCAVLAEAVIHAARNITPVASAAPRPWEEEATDRDDGLGLQVRRPTPNHVQFLQDGKVFAEWWPSKGTTRTPEGRGPICATGEDVLAWLKTM